MLILIILVSGFIGATLGAAADRSFGMFGFFAGIAFGILLVRLRSLGSQVQALRRELQGLQQRGTGPIVTPAAAPATATATANVADELPIALRIDEVTPLADAAATASLTDGTPSVESIGSPVDSAPVSRWLPPRMPEDAAPAARKASPDPIDVALTTLKHWFTEGNVPVKVGVLVLFAGVGALLKYAANQGWLSLPIGMRLAAVAAVAVAALFFGWKERARRRAFGLTMQGGAIGILLMTVFASFRLYNLLPGGVSFGLMLLLVAATCGLAIAQDSMALAVLALIAGFAAPILSSSGDGSHVFLFSYYALFNIGIFAIALLRSWRVLNLVGFAFTFVIGIAWGVLRYQPAQFGSVEPFLLLFFGIYLAIPIVNGLRREPARRDPVDGTLVFGNPLLAFALQTGLFEARPTPLAWSAIALAALYALLAWWLLRRTRVLGEAFAVLSVAFATLAVPLALSAWATACVFALEGAGLLWLGFRQQQRMQRWSGLALQLLAAAAFAYSLAANEMQETRAFLNSSCMSALLIAGAGLVSAWLYSRDAATRPTALPLYLWGLAWWLGANLREIHRFVPDALQPSALLALAAVTAVLAAFAWRGIRQAALAWTTAVALACGALLMLHFAVATLRPWETWPLAAFAAYAVLGFICLRQLHAAPATPVSLAHSGWIWMWTLAFGFVAWFAAADAGLGDGWRAALPVLPLLAAWTLVLHRPEWVAPPLATRFAEWRRPLATSQALIASAAFFVLMGIPGSATPLAWLPLLNPLELVQLATLLCAASWLRAPLATPQLITSRPLVLGVASLAFVTAATLRGVHHLGGLPWDAQLLPSALAQTSLTVAWSVLGVAGWVIGSRRGSRALWLASALLMGVVLAKLLLVDRGHLGSVLGIVSFIAYGLLCTVIGYLAPAPPRAAAVK
jgi:uncharacterized membrane protein